MEVFPPVFGKSEAGPIALSGTLASKLADRASRFADRHRLNPEAALPLSVKNMRPFDSLLAAGLTSFLI
jgi:hypothetical protein